MANNNFWAKVWYKMLDDRHVQQLSDKAHRLWIDSILLAGEHNAGGLLPHPEEIQWRLRHLYNSVEELTEVYNELERAGLVHTVTSETGFGWMVTNYAKYQKRTASNAERQRAYRERKGRGDDRQRKELREAFDSVAKR